MSIKLHLSKFMGAKRLRGIDIAKKTGITQNTIVSLYHERVDGIRFDTLEKLCKVLSCGVGDLLEYIPDGKKAKETKAKRKKS